MACFGGCGGAGFGAGAVAEPGAEEGAGGVAVGGAITLAGGLSLGAMTAGVAVGAAEPGFVQVGAGSW